MSSNPDLVATTSIRVVPQRGWPERRQRVAFTVTLLILLLAFALPLIDLVRFAWDSSLYSHIPLVPFVALYLVWLDRAKLPGIGPRATAATVVCAVLAAVALAAYVAIRVSGVALSPESLLAAPTAALLLLVAGATGWFLGRNRLRALAFPLSFLVFMVPLPESWLSSIETVLQHGSAAVAGALFRIGQIAVFYQDLTFQLPGVSLHVAPECSGIHSSLALLMVSLLAGHVFLRSRLHAAILAGAVFPLALLRNGFRIYTVGALCVKDGPAMIESPIHRQGGPLFFAASLIPFFLLLWVLMRRERQA